MPRPLTLLRALCWPVAAAVLALPLCAPGGPLRQGAAYAGGGLVVSGDVAGLLPGVAAPLLVTVRNPTPHDAVVRTLQVTATGPRGCRLEVAPWSGRLPVAAGASVTRALTATVAPGPGCDGATWSLGYSATT